MKYQKKVAVLISLQAVALPLLAAQAEQPADEQREVRVIREISEGPERPADVPTEVRLRDAEHRLAEAARQVADLSMSQLPRVERIERIIRAGGGPVLGVTIGAGDDGGPAEGVEILGVSPGGAAEEAGLRTGDVITAINGESMSAGDGEAAGNRLLDFMKGVAVGDVLELEYLRNGKTERAALAPQEMSQSFAFGFSGRDFARTPGAPPSPAAPRFENFAWISHVDSFGDMELALLTEGLGRYFGTSKGLLVVRAPSGDDLKLQDGDVILSVDGREPQTVAHAMRILGSYQSGEKLRIEIMRDKRKQTVEIEVPDNRQSLLAPEQPPVAIAP